MLPQFLLESSICLAIFYSFYHFFLQKETFFQLNRGYLLVTPLLSLTIPLLDISLAPAPLPNRMEAVIFPAVQSSQEFSALVWTQINEPSEVLQLTITDLILAIYGLGAIAMGIVLVKRFWRLQQLIRQYPKRKNKDFTAVLTNNHFPAASFFGYIFWNNQLTDEQQLILEHEKVHVRQWHSLDVLLMEILVVFKWFNPLIYGFRNALRATHEYIADQYVIRHRSNIREYATLLVNHYQTTPQNPLTNTFFSLTKKRLQMMLRQPSNNYRLFKYLLLLPVTGFLLTLFSFNLAEEIPSVESGLQNLEQAWTEAENTTLLQIPTDQPATRFQVKWGAYTFDCEEKIRGKRRHCDCEGRFVKASDLPEMAEGGLHFHKNEEQMEVKNIKINLMDREVYCEEKEMLMSVSEMPVFDKKDCLWQALKEKDKITISFQNDYFYRVSIPIAIDSQKGKQPIEEAAIWYDGKKLLLGDNHIYADTEISFGQLKEIAQSENLQLELFGELVPIDFIEVMGYQFATSGGYIINVRNVRKESIKTLKTLDYNDDDLFTILSHSSKKEGKNGIILLSRLKNHDKISSQTFTWGGKPFSFKSPHIFVTKSELKKLIQQPGIKSPLNLDITYISGLIFEYLEGTTIPCKEEEPYEMAQLQNLSCLTDGIEQMQAGDLLSMWVKSDFSALRMYVVLTEEKNPPTQPIVRIKQSLADGKKSRTSLPTLLTYRNYPVQNIILDLLDLKPAQIQFKNEENVPNLNVQVIAPEDTDLKRVLLEALQQEYPFTIKNKTVEKETWFLTGGDIDKLSRHKADAVQLNFEFIKKSNTRKGLETLGPVEFDWLATRYFELEYDMEVINLTNINGKYILPLKTDSFEELRKFLQDQYNLTLRQEKRMLEVQEIAFQ